MWTEKNSDFEIFEPQGNQLWLGFEFERSCWNWQRRTQVWIDSKLWEDRFRKFPNRAGNFRPQSIKIVHGKIPNQDPGKSQDPQHGIQRTGLFNKLRGFPIKNHNRSSLSLQRKCLLLHSHHKSNKIRHWTDQSWFRQKIQKRYRKFVHVRKHEKWFWSRKEKCSVFTAQITGCSLMARSHQGSRKIQKSLRAQSKDQFCSRKRKRSFGTRNQQTDWKWANYQLPKKSNLIKHVALHSLRSTKIRKISCCTKHSEFIQKMYHQFGRNYWLAYQHGNWIG